MLVNICLWQFVSLCSGSVKTNYSEKMHIANSCSTQCRKHIRDRIVLMTKMESLTKQDQRWRKLKRSPERMTNFIVAPLAYRSQKWLHRLRLGIPKEDLPLSQSARKH